MTLSRRVFLLASMPFPLAPPSARAAADSEGPGPVPTSPDPAAVEFLLAAAAKEFGTPGRIRPAAIRKARIGYLSDPGRPGRYLLCGSFRTGESKGSAWVPFATIKTSDYEQWLGGVAESICRSKQVRWYEGDRSEALLQRLRG